MSDNYARIIRDNLAKLYAPAHDNLVQRLPGHRHGDEVLFDAFGQRCRLGPRGIFLDEKEETGAMGIVVSLYALHVPTDECVLEPFKAFRDLPNSMPYVGAFASHTEAILVKHVPAIRKARKEIMKLLQGRESPPSVGGDFSFVVYPLPKIALCYIFYEADEEFDASVTCLFSNNAHLFLPLDPLADSAEFTSGMILDLL